MAFPHAASMSFASLIQIICLRSSWGFFLLSLAIIICKGAIDRYATPCWLRRLIVLTLVFNIISAVWSLINLIKYPISLTALGAKNIIYLLFLNMPSILGIPLWCVLLTRPSAANVNVDTKHNIVPSAIAHDSEQLSFDLSVFTSQSARSYSHFAPLLMRVGLPMAVYLACLVL